MQLFSIFIESRKIDMWRALCTYPSLVSTCTRTVFIIRKKEITLCNVSSQNFISKVAFCKHTHKCYKHKSIGILDSKENKGKILYWFFLHEKTNVGETKCTQNEMYSLFLTLKNWLLNINWYLVLFLSRLLAYSILFSVALQFL